MLQILGPLGTAVALLQAAEYCKAGVPVADSTDSESDEELRYAAAVAASQRAEQRSQCSADAVARSAAVAVVYCDSAMPGR